MSDYKPVIGLEIHVELKTKSKMFCQCSANYFGEKPNIHVCPVCLGMPGALPVPNKQAVEWTILIGKALNCTINKISKFDRKHYFYPDLPKGYQISQYDQPISKNGHLDVNVGRKIKRIGITRAHLEEDAGKNIHPEGLSYSLVDYNRAGAPLLEIVTEPDIESGEEARAFLTELRSIIRYLGASDCDMEKGTMRCEPNISVRKPGETILPKYKVEVKNINSFKFAEAAINYEVARQTEILKEGGTPKQVTMGWDEKNSFTVEQRSKEEANDYRYFPDPDLPVLQFTKEYLDDLRNKMPELPAQKRQRFISEFGLPTADVENLINWKELANYFEEVVSEIDEWIEQESGLDRNSLIKQAANWSLQDFSAMLNSKAINPQDSTVTPENLAELIKLIQQGKISGSAAKTIFKVMFEKGGEPLSIVSDLGLEQTSNTAEISAAIDRVISINEKAVADYKAGEQKSFGFLVGQTMKELKGKGNPQVINDILRKKLSS